MVALAAQNASTKTRFVVAIIVLLLIYIGYTTQNAGFTKFYFETGRFSHE